MWKILVEPCNFSKALAELKEGKMLQRAPWGGAFVRRQIPNEHSKMSVPYYYKHYPNPDGKDVLVPWTPSQEDLEATDWVMLEL